MTRRVVPLARKLWPLALALILAPACSGKRVTLPEFHGRVVDARTGAPIAGAIVKRRLYEAGPISIGDGSRPLGVEGGEVVTHSNADGRFVLPSFGARRYTGMGWLVYKPGWMPIYGCYAEEGWAFGGCSGFGAPGNDPWASATFSKSGDVVTFEVRVFPPTLEGVTFRSYNVYTKEWVTYTPTPEDKDPWIHYLRRLRILCELLWLPIEDFVSEALVAEKQALPTPQFLDEIAKVQGTLGGYHEDQPCYKASLAVTLLDLLDRVCSSHPGWRACEPSATASRRSFLERNCSTDRR